ncbi:uncharacterized protein LOC112461189 [Temnothorax curvispinosus]|uniref:Uncharacterized protein LOC112461189 n=1 Tax=Temnothorax curvispinosus TaxID=300111 RepID=A0A6J1QJR1_9HYME|nr:uncharacterized protein LOC112461189 [Temnothorax curvispinosus]
MLGLKFLPVGVQRFNASFKDASSNVGFAQLSRVFRCSGYTGLLELTGARTHRPYTDAEPDIRLEGPKCLSARDGWSGTGGSVLYLDRVLILITISLFSQRVYNKVLE